MKSRNLILTAIFALGIAFTSCKDDVISTEVIVNESATASIKLYVKANLDTVGGVGVFEKVPDSTQFIISVNKSDLNNTLTSDGKWQTIVTSTGGVIEVDFPASNSGVTVYIDAISFESTYYDKLSTDLKAYELNIFYNNMMIGQNKIASANFSDITLESTPVVTP